MSDLDEIVGDIKHDLAPDYANRLRAALRDQDKAWLVDELVRLIVERDLGVAPQTDVANPAVVDEEYIGRFVSDSAKAARDGLVRDGAPAKGTLLLAPVHRTAEGEAALVRARGTLSALLFGDEASGVALDRVRAVRD